ncbi:exonuclease domain-containing protein [Tengunoibacter tsumagoiensis]|uniref:Exonuclease domain-containing protein n=1 Tax=Tengunoibacter tsumagoiensis TaxID=2014871 RepID=A0A401ZXQ8_9CHLR|nr:exonuclease domain-containing protein [Tengunoibacter tsumagoiensis]GCE11631.1 hypothetical protein KTT_14900 [Tengunoibacter tsumagoiensis]
MIHSQQTPQELFWSAWQQQQMPRLYPSFSLGNYCADFAHPDTRTILEITRLAPDTLRDQVKRAGWQIVSLPEREIITNVQGAVKRIANLLANKAVYLQKKSETAPRLQAVSVPSPLPPSLSQPLADPLLAPMTATKSPSAQVPPPPLPILRPTTKQTVSPFMTTKQTVSPLMTTKQASSIRPCPRCGAPLRKPELPCPSCQDQPSSTTKSVSAIAWARTLMQRDDWVVIDTETTGLTRDDEIVEIAIVGSKGQILVDTLIRPLQRIPLEASAVHHIYDADVKGAPTFAQLWPQIAPHFEGLVLAYNAQFDIRLLRQTLGQSALALPSLMTHDCIMKRYASYQKDCYGSGQPRQSLKHACTHFGIKPGVHRALGDTIAAWEVVKKLSELA